MGRLQATSLEAKALMREPFSPSEPPRLFVVSLDRAQMQKLKADLEERAFEFTQPQNTVFSAKKEGVVCTLYTSGKLVVQGKDIASFVEFYLEPELLGSFTFSHKAALVDHKPRIGVDESGKGDFFGPLCIAGVYAADGDVEKLLKIGVRDSKQMQEGTILRMAQTIKENFIHQIVVIRPPRYNELYPQFGNLNSLLGWGHATVIDNLVQKSGCPCVIIDQFASEYVVKRALSKKGVAVDLTQRHRGEEDPVVAAASILARATFVLELKALEEEIGMPLPKGASIFTLKAGKALLERYGIEIFPKVSKLHFKTYRDITGVKASDAETDFSL